MGYYGYIRTTGDMDVWIAIHPSNAQKTVDALKEFGFNVPNLSMDLFLREKQITRMGIPPMRIEILTTISGVSFVECYAKRITGVIDGVEVNLISLEDLKANKRASGRLKDLNDLANLS